MRKLTGTELSALTALVSAESVQREGSNNNALIQGKIVPYDDETKWASLDRLRAELGKRGVL